MTREKAIKIMRKEIECLSHSRCRDCILEKVCDPNTNPTDDEYIEAFGMAINSLEIDERYELEYEQIEPCDDAISREPFTNSTICEGFSCEECSFNRKDKGGCILEERVMKLPPVTPKTKTGHWREDIDNNRRWDRVRFYCSECGKWQTYGKTHYCPNCGAKMQEEEE